MSKVRYMQGNEAIAEGAFLAGARFYAGYPITPSSEIAEISSQRLPALGGVYMQMEDEIASMAAIIGASLAGKKSFTATSGPGFSLMQENLGLAKMLEVPCVVVNIMRVGPSTALATRPAQGDVMQARYGTHGDASVVALCPATVQDCFDLSIKAFEFSERFRCPVVLLGDEVVGHLRERVVIPDDIKPYPRRMPSGNGEYLPYAPGADGVPPLAVLGGDRMLHVTSSMHDETGRTNNEPENADRFIKRLTSKIEDHTDEAVLARSYGDPGAPVLLVSYGAASRAAWAALDLAKRQGINMRLLQLLTLWPFAADEIRRQSKNASAVVVVEMNLGQVYREVRGVSQAPVHSLTKTNGEPIEPHEIVDGVREVLK